MQKYQDIATVIGPPGLIPIRGVNVSVYQLRGLTTTTIYSDNVSTVTANPLTTDQSGRYSFYAPDGHYTLEISSPSLQTTQVFDVLLQDTSAVQAYGTSINLSRWINAGRVIAGSSSDAIFTHIEDAVSEASNLGKACEFSGAWLLQGSLVTPSNMTFEGQGFSSSLVIPDNLNGPVVKNSGVTSNVILRNFKLKGNSANQPTNNATRAGVYFDENASGILLENLWADDVKDWGFSFKGSDGTIRRCRASNITGAEDANSVRSGFLIGDGTHSASQITIDDCLAFNCSVAFTDGFIFERGSDVSLTNSRCLGMPYTGFKLKMDDMRLIGNRASGCGTGFQSQGSLSHLKQIGNTAYRCNGSGFQYNQFDVGITAYDWTVIGNHAIENGQSSSATTRYGFAFENTAGCVTDGLLMHGNHAVDLGSGTQQRGISFGASGTYRNVLVGPNNTKGNVLDINIGASVETSSYTKLWNRGTSSNSYPGSWPTSVQRFQFWTDNLATGTVVLSDGVGGRGHQIPRYGYIRGLAVKSNANITAGNATFQLRVNGAINSNFNAALSSTNPSFISNEQNFQVPANILAAGDMITVIATGDAGLLPNGSADFDAVVEVAY